jgi:hypothetical protein
LPLTKGRAASRRDRERALTCPVRPSGRLLAGVTRPRVVRFPERMQMGYVLRGAARAFLAVIGSTVFASLGLLNSPALAATTATTAMACTICGHNLISNPGAEASPGTQSDSVVHVPGWKLAQGSFTAASYAWGGGDLSATTPGPPNRGKNYFYGGPDAAVSVGTQTLLLAAGATQISTGKVTATLGAWLGGYVDQGDDAALTVSFQGANDQVLKALTIGPVTAAQRKDTSELLHRGTTTVVPVGTTTAVLTLRLVRYSGDDNDGMADNLSLVLTAGT